MPIINFELTDADTERLDAEAKRQLRARKHAVSVLVIERLDQIDAEKTAETLRQSLQLGPEQSPPVPDALAADLGVKS